MELYRKFVLQKQESYKLDFIAMKDLGVGKLEFDGTLKELYENDPETFIEYNRIDVERTMQINDKRMLVQNAVGIAYLAKCQFEDAFLTTRPWDVIIANHLRETNIHVPAIDSDNDKTEKYEGAFVKDPQIGFHEWVMSFDLGSLYPSLMITYNISPETMLPRDTFIRIRPEDIANDTDKYRQAKQLADKMNATLCANGAMFTREKQGFVPFLVEGMIKERKVAKRAMMDWKTEAERVKSEINKRKQK
jgi:DNA polymerase elongation subunit (family B)